jgi:dTDP-4-dehydrorhamnose reductase
VKFLLTGGKGRLGRALQTLIPGIIAPPRDDLDLTVPETIASVLELYHPEAIIHAGAYTDVVYAERDRTLCWKTNVGGTRNLARLAVRFNAFLIHISTDYVFSGETGDYRETDTPGPVQNYYALSKLAAEEVARMAPRHLIIRTSFRVAPWPYSTAYVDLYTSQDYLPVIAAELALALTYLSEIPYDTLHIAGPRISAYQLARRTRPDVRATLRAESPVRLPADVSLNTSRWLNLKRRWKSDEARSEN